MEILMFLFLFFDFYLSAHTTYTSHPHFLGSPSLYLSLAYLEHTGPTKRLTSTAIYFSLSQAVWEFTLPFTPSFIFLCFINTYQYQPYRPAPKSTLFSLHRSCYFVVFVAFILYLRQHSTAHCTFIQLSMCCRCVIVENWS